MQSVYIVRASAVGPHSDRTFAYTTSPATTTTSASATTTTSTSATTTTSPATTTTFTTATANTTNATSTTNTITFAYKFTQNHLINYTVLSFSSVR